MDRHSYSSVGIPAPYGHACTSCAQSKCKCIIRPAGGPCERCYRLNRECRPVESVRRRNHKRPPVAKTKKAERLEEKLDGLISLIKSNAPTGTVISPPQTTPSISHSTSDGNIHTNASTPTYNQVDQGSFLGGSSNYVPNAPSSMTGVSDGTGSSYYEPSTAEAEEYLINFQTHKSKYFPFVYIPSTTNAQQLRHERPFLWLSIMAVGSKSTSQQQALGKKIRQTVAQEMVVRSVRNIDLLLGLLAFIGWANYQVQNNPFLTVFTQLAVSLVFELGLSKPVLKDTQMTPCGNQKYAMPTADRTMEERRAVLSCFLITSIISSFFQKIDALRWTPHMDQCLRELDERQEHPGDEVLVQQVRLQLIVDKMNLGISHDGATPGYLESLHLQLQGVKASLPSKSQKNEVVLLHLYNTELETALSPTFLHVTQFTPQQRKAVTAGVESIKSWFEVFFSIHPSAYIGFPFSILSQLIRCLMTLYKLRILDDPALDETGIWENADPILVLDQVVNNMEQVPILAGLDNSDSPEGDIFSRLAHLFRSRRPGWEAKLRPDGPMLSSIPTPRSIDEIPIPDFLGMEFFDNEWLVDIDIPPS